MIYLQPGCFRGGALVQSSCLLSEPSPAQQGTWAARGEGGGSVDDVCNQDNLCYG